MRIKLVVITIHNDRKMAGGLLNLVAYGTQNVILNGNPSKTFFKCTYAIYTNFARRKNFV